MMNEIICRDSAYAGFIADLSTLPFAFIYDDKACKEFSADTFRPVSHRQSVQPSVWNEGPSLRPRLKP